MEVIRILDQTSFQTPTFPFFKKPLFSVSLTHYSTIKNPQGCKYSILKNDVRYQIERGDGERREERETESKKEIRTCGSPHDGQVILCIK